MDGSAAKSEAARGVEGRVLPEEAMPAVEDAVSAAGIVMVVAFSVEPVDMDGCVRSDMSGTGCWAVSAGM